MLASPSRIPLAVLLALSSLSACADDVTGAGPDDDDGGTSSGTGAVPDPTVDPGTTSGPGSTSTDPGTSDPTIDPDSSGGEACAGPEDCADLASECTEATCEAGRCVVQNAEAGTACGDATDTACNGADTCDGAGTCVDNVPGDGTACTECDGVECACSAGACSACAAFADTNEFTTDRALLGWEMTGDWRLYTGAPSAYMAEEVLFGLGGGDDVLLPAIPFGGQVFGTDGNRSAPYPGGHEETSYARTKAFVLPDTLQFRSWHQDEGGGEFDNKFVRVSLDGKTWTTLHDCQDKISALSPLCEGVELREGDDWDDIALTVPPAMVGQVGFVEFAYETGDGCCGFERGWFIDTANFATECACGADSTCDAFATECGTGTCGAGGACELAAVEAGEACGSNAATSCGSADACDAYGYCQPNDLVNLLACEDCPAGAENCNGCLDGACLDCPTPTDSFLAGTPGWGRPPTVGGGWAVFSEIPSNENGDGPIAPADTAFLGNDGSTNGAADGVGEEVSASIVSPPDTMPATLTFDSWHVDQGGMVVIDVGYPDTKRIEVSVDGGGGWETLVDCADPLLDDYPFCLQVVSRGADEWDAISIDTSAYAGMDALLRFTYETGSACCGFEYGWYIDNLNIAQVCADPSPAEPEPGKEK